MKFFTFVFRDPVLRRLCKVAAVGGAFSIASALFFQSKIRSNLLNSPSVTESLKVFKDHQAAVDFVGPPIGIGKIDLGSKNNFKTNTRAQFEIPITGKKHNGQLHLWASRPDYTSSWTVDRLEVSLDDMPGQRILVHKAEAREEQQGQQ